MNASPSSRKFIMGNAAMLAVRTVIAAIIGLYSSRLVLKALGIEDFGVYSVVAGIPVALEFLNVTLTSASSRFLAYNIGKDGDEATQRTFSASLMVHLCIAGIVLILSETLGLWALRSWLNIPTHKLAEAQVLYQFVVVAALMRIIQVPFTSAIIAHERMRFYALIEIANSVMKLAVAVVLVIYAADAPLILYGALLMVVSIVITFVYIFYCHQSLSNCRFNLRVERTALHPLLKYSATDLYGNLCVSAYSQGFIFLVNLFFGVIYNTALSLAQSVQAIISGLSLSVTNAFRPQIVKQYAAQAYRRVDALLADTLRFTLIIYMVISVPLAIEAPEAIKLWLGTLPAHTPAFLRLCLLVGLFSVTLNIINIAFHASGRIFKLTVIGGTIHLLIPFAIWIAYQHHSLALTAFIIIASALAILCVVELILMHRQLPELHASALAIQFLLVLLICIPGTLAATYISTLLDAGILHIMATGAAFILPTAVIVWFIYSHQQSHSDAIS